MWTQKEIDNLIKRFSYKRGFGFHVYSLDPFTYVLMISAIANDSNNPDTDITLHHRKQFLFDPRDSEEAIIMQLQESIRDFEMHEVDEWFKFDGKHVNNPHKSPLF